MITRGGWLFLFSCYMTAMAILPNYYHSPSLGSEMKRPLDFDLIRSLRENKLNVKRNPSKSSDDPFSSIEGLRKELSKMTLPRGDRSAAVPARSIKELEELMSHPTWLTDSSKKKVNRQLAENRQLGDNKHSAQKSKRIFAAPLAPQASDGQMFPKVAEDQKEHIKEIITKFQTFKPKPITDNRISKFVFTHDGDLAMSKTVQEHNKEVEAAFLDFNKKLEETLNTKEKKNEDDKKVTNKQPIKSETSSDDPQQDVSFDNVINFLNRNIHRLKEDVPQQHKLVCSKHNSHTKDDDDDEIDDPLLADFSGVKHRLSELAQTREGLENILLGLDRPRRGPFRREIAPKPNKAPVAFPNKK